MSGFNRSALVDLLAEFGRDTLIEQGDFSTAIMDFGQIPGVDKKDPAKIFDKVPGKRPVGRVNPVLGGLASGGFTKGGATRRAAASSSPKAGTYQHAMIEQDVDFDEDIVRLGDVDGGIESVMSQLKIAGTSAARLVERAFLGHELSTCNEVETIGSAKTVNVLVVAGLRPNMLVDRYASNGTSLVQAGMKITAVTDNGDGTGTATFDSLTADTAVGERLFLAGSGGAGAPYSADPLRCVNLQDVTAQSTILYSGLALADQPAGVLETGESSWSNRAGKRIMARCMVNVGDKPTHLIVHPYQAQEIYESQNQTLQFRSNDTLDVYGPRMTFDGAEVVECNNQNEDRIDFVNARSHAMQVHEFWGFSPIDGSGKNGRWAKESLQLMHDRHSLTLFLNGAYNLRVTRRDAHGAMTGLDVTP
jgi:hypothetical protein